MQKKFCPVTWKYFILNLWLGKISWSVPFVWCNTENKLKVCHRGRRNLLVLIGFDVIYILYLGSTIYYDWITSNVFREPVTFGDIVMRLEYLIVCFNMVVLMLNTFFLSNLYLQYINDWINLYFYFSDRYVLKKFKPWELPCGIILKVISFTYILTPFGQVVHFLELPLSKTYITWVFEAVKIPIIIAGVYLIQIMFIIGVMIGNYCVAVFHVFIVLIPLSICITALKECRPGINPFVKFKTFNFLRSPSDALKIYHAHFILNQQANIIASHLLYALQTLNSYSIVISIICLLHFGVEVGYKTAFIIGVIGVIGYSFWFTILQTGGIFTNKTKLWTVHWSKAVWSRQCNKQYCKKVGRSLKPLQMDFSGCYKLTLIRVLRFVNFIMWTAMKGLLFISKN